MAKNKADKYLSGGIKKRETEEAPKELLDILNVQRSEPERVQKEEVKEEKDVAYRHAYDVYYDSTNAIYVLVTFKYQVGSTKVIDIQKKNLYDNKLRAMDEVRKLFASKIIGRDNN